MDREIVNPDIEQYLMGLSREKDPVLRAMEEIAHEQDFPIVDRLVGRLLMMLARLKSPKLVVELGSGFGYSAYWFLRAMSGGKIVLTDTSHEYLDGARKNLHHVTGDVDVKYLEGDAIELATKYKDIDILFIDIEKVDYLRALKTLEPMLAKDALVIADNTIWYGRVLDTEPDEETKGIQEFNEYVMGSDKYDSSIIPLRDGVLVALKRD